MKISYKNHYDFLIKELPYFFKELGILNVPIQPFITCYGDKVEQYKNKWEEANLPFYLCTAIYLLSYIEPFSKECRETAMGWVAPDQWVMGNYSRFLKHFSSHVIQHFCDDGQD